MTIIDFRVIELFQACTKPKAVSTNHRITETTEPMTRANNDLAEGVVWRRTIPAFAIITSSGRIRTIALSARWRTLNCGYGHSFSVREVVEMVKCVSASVDFKVDRTAPGRVIP
jgi:hypothetical protein